MADNEKSVSTNVFKNDNPYERKTALAKILADVINTQIKTEKSC